MLGVQAFRRWLSIVFQTLIAQPQSDAIETNTSNLQSCRHSTEWRMGIRLVQGAQEFFGRECDPDVCSTITIDNGTRQEDCNRHVLSSREQQMRYMYGLQAWASGVKAGLCWCASRVLQTLVRIHCGHAGPSSEGFRSNSSEGRWRTSAGPSSEPQPQPQHAGVPLREPGRSRLPAAGQGSAQVAVSCRRLLPLRSGRSLSGGSCSFAA